MQRNLSLPQAVPPLDSGDREVTEPQLLLARACLAFVHGFTLIALCFYAYVVRAKVELQHPVFAVVFQETVVLSALELANFLAILSSGVDYFNQFQPLVLQCLAVQFHQWSWLAVTYLRLSIRSHVSTNYINYSKKIFGNTGTSCCASSLLERMLTCPT